MKSLVFALALFAPTFAFAQLDAANVEPFMFTVSPEYPRPQSTVTITPQSTQLDLANSTMTFTVNGKEIYRGGTRAVSATLDSIGQITTIKVAITSAGQTFAKTLWLKPGDVSLVIEPISSAPALYKGKPLVPQNGRVRMVAIADLRTTPLKRIDPATLSYSWVVDGTTLINASGIGRDSIVVPSPLQYRNQTVSVTVQSRDGTLTGGDTATLVPQNATLRLYINDPLQGILYDHALSNTYTITGSEATIMVVPYSLALSQSAEAIRWFLNGSPAQTGASITLRPEGAGQGDASLSATTGSGANADPVTAALTIIFGKTSNLFGL